MNIFLKKTLIQKGAKLTISDVDKTGKGRGKKKCVKCFYVGT